MAMASQSASDSPLVIALQDVGLDAIALVGGKNASLGEMIRELSAAGLRVPGGFATTANAYQSLLDVSDLRSDLSLLLRNLDVSDLERLQRTGAQARALILGTHFPDVLEDAILTAYRQLGSPPVAVRSSATAEDLPQASFAGQQET
ncbi:MAG: phosphoenolpyruvate synthase, partial [Cyanobacteriota bacterium]